MKNKHYSQLTVAYAHRGQISNAFGAHVIGKLNRAGYGEFGFTIQSDVKPTTPSSHEAERDGRYHLEAYRNPHTRTYHPSDPAVEIDYTVHRAKQVLTLENLITRIPHVLPANQLVRELEGIAKIAQYTLCDDQLYSGS